MKDFSVEVTPANKIAGSSDAIVVKTHGSINSSTTPTLDAEFEDLIARKHHTLIVDLSDTDFISSSGIGVLLSTVNVLRDKGGDLILMNPPKLIDDILEIMNIRNYFRSIKSLDELSSVTR
jgi:anti-sigma B factor antagonist